MKIELLGNSECGLYIVRNRLIAMDVSSNEETLQERISLVSEKLKILVTNSIGQYGLDITRVMAMASRTSYRFRYYEKWLPNLVDDIRVGRVKPPCEGLVVLRHFTTAQFVPVRYVRITEIVVLGDTYYIVFEPGRFVNLSENEQERQEQLEKFNRVLGPLITENGKFPNTPNEDFQNLFCEITDIVPEIEIDSGQDKSDMKAWANLVSELKEWPFYQGNGFYRIFSITPVTDECSEPYFADNEKISTIELGRTYALRVLHTQHDPVSVDSTINQRVFNLNSNDERLIIDRKTSVIKSRYDVAELKFHLGSGFVGKDTASLELGYTDGDGKDLLYPQYIPLKIDGESRMFGVIKGAITIILLALWAILRSGLFLPPEMGLDSLVIVILVLTLSIPKNALSVLGLK